MVEAEDVPDFLAGDVQPVGGGIPIEIAIFGESMIQRLLFFVPLPWC